MPTWSNSTSCNDGLSRKTRRSASCRPGYPARLDLRHGPAPPPSGSDTAWSGEFVPALNRLAEALAENASVVANRREAIAVATG